MGTAQNSRSRPPCPTCGRIGIPVVFGMPRSDLVEAAERGEVILAGCVLEEHMPTHACSAGHRWDDNESGWPVDFPIDSNGKVEEGLVVRSISGDIEGRTTGSRRRCLSKGCPGWFITVSWESGQIMHPCSEGWRYDPETNEIRVVAGGEISARFVSPSPLGTPPRPPSEWPDPVELRGKGWRVNPKRP